jgi:hypothetical protein
VQVQVSSFLAPAVQQTERSPQPHASPRGMQSPSLGPAALAR